MNRFYVDHNIPDKVANTMEYMIKNFGAPMNLFYDFRSIKDFTSLLKFETDWKPRPKEFFRIKSEEFTWYHHPGTYVLDIFEKFHGNLPDDEYPHPLWSWIKLPFLSRNEHFALINEQDDNRVIGVNRFYAINLRNSKDLMQCKLTLKDIIFNDKFPLENNLEQMVLFRDQLEEQIRQDEKNRQIPLK